MAPRRQSDLGLSGALPMMPLPKVGPLDRWLAEQAAFEAQAEAAYLDRREGHSDPGEHKPAEDRLAQQRTWQARLVSMARRGRGSEAQRLAGRLLDGHGLDARRVLLEDLEADERTAARVNALLADCGLTPWGPTTHQAEQEALL